MKKAFLGNYFYNGVILVIVILFISCQHRQIDMRDYINGWEYITTYKVLPSHSINFVKRSPHAVLGFAELIFGKNNVLTCSIEKRPIFKLGHILTDLVTYRDLLIELDPNDTVITPSHLGQSKIYRQIIKMTPDAGADFLKAEEKIEIRRLPRNRWRVKSELEDFQFESEFSFADSSTVTSKWREMLVDQ